MTDRVNAKSSHDAVGAMQNRAEIDRVDDYNGMDIKEWKAALLKDVRERFGPTPDNLVSVSDAGW